MSFFFQCLPNSGICIATYTDVIGLIVFVGIFGALIGYALVRNVK